MKIYPINNIKKYAGLALLSGSIVCTPVQAKNNNIENDVFNRIETSITNKVLPSDGSKDVSVLSNAPSCDIVVQGERKKAIIVVDLANNILYKYDSEGNPEIAYSIAKGKPSTPTHKGLRRVSHIEVFPYKTAPKSTKRHKNPRPYGDRVIVLDKFDPKTGEIDTTGEFIHGNGDNDTSMGQDVSGGCMRLPNIAVVTLAKQVKRGDFVLIK